MTVGELRKKLDGLADAMHVVVVRPDEAGRGMLEIGSVSPHRGEPGRRQGDGAAWFDYDHRGSVEWLFIETEEA